MFQRSQPSTDGRWSAGDRKLRRADKDPARQKSVNSRIGERVMKRRNVRSAIGLICSLMMMASGLACPVWAQDATADPILKLYVDPTTHVVYTEPGRGRRLLATIPSSAISGSTNSLEQRQERTEQELQENRAQLTELAQKNQQLESQNENFQTQIAEIKPAWRSYVDNFQDKFRLGTLVYGDYRY